MFGSRIKGRLQKFIPLPLPAFLGGRESPKFTVCPEKHRNFLSWIYSIFLWIHIGWKYNISTSELNIGVKMNPLKQWKTSKKKGGGSPVMLCSNGALLWLAGPHPPQSIYTALGMKIAPKNWFLDHPLHFSEKFQKIHKWGGGVRSKFFWHLP